MLIGQAILSSVRTVSKLQNDTLWKFIKTISCYTSKILGLHGVRKCWPGSAVSQAWHAMGDQGFGVWEVMGSNPGGTPHFGGVNFKWDRLVTSWSVRISKWYHDRLFSPLWYVLSLSPPFHTANFEEHDAFRTCSACVQQVYLQTFVKTQNVLQNICRTHPEYI